MSTVASVAREFAVHPANLILLMSCQGASFEDIWPECNPDWVAAVRSAHWDKLGGAGRRDVPAAVKPTVNEADDLSATARRILSKMAAKRHYGTNTVSFDTVKKHYGIAANDAEEAMEELLARGLLLTEDRRGPYRLDPGRKGEIERITGIKG